MCVMYITDTLTTTMATSPDSTISTVLLIKGMDNEKDLETPSHLRGMVEQTS
jgi:hypothetical protein